MTRPPSSAERQRLRSVNSLWRALLPLLFVVGVVVLFTWPRGTRSDGIHVVDTAGPIAAARDAAGFAVPAPSGLPATWRPTSTQFTPSAPDHGASFRIGYVTPAGGYGEYLTSNDAQAAVTALYGPLTQTGRALVNGAVWTKFETAKNRELLTRTSGTVTVIVTGSAAESELVALAGSLTDPSGKPF